MQNLSVVLAVLMTTTILAGCLSDDAPQIDDPTVQTPRHEGVGVVFEESDDTGLPVPKLLCFDAMTIDAWDGEGQWTDYTVLPDGTRCNMEMTPDEGRQGNEVTIAVNPTDPRNIVGGAKDYFPADAGECVWDGVYVTHDGGRTPYLDRNFDGSPWRIEQTGPETFEPNYASQFWCTTDPVAYFNTGGQLYYLLMAYQADRVTGSKTGEDLAESCPGIINGDPCEAWPGALNDWAFNRAVQIVAVSDDGGDTFHTFTPILEGTFPVNFHDKGWLAASHDGTIHVMWLAVLSPGNMYFRSTDGGQSYPVQDMEVLAPIGQGSGQGSFIDVGTGPEVYALWTSGSAVQLRRSMDYGDTWEAQNAILGRNTISMPGLEDRDRRSGWPALATDRNPDSPFGDALYVVWQDACKNTTAWSQGCRAEGGGSSIWFSSSFDKGTTWGEPVQIARPQQDGEWNIFPAVSVSPGGVIDVSWMTTRGTRQIACHDEAPHCQSNYGEAYPTFEQSYVYSLDGGATWSNEFSVRDATDNGWDPSKCHHQNGMVFIGDYNDIDSSWQAAHPVWPDSRDGPCDVYTATIQRPQFADGWEPAPRAEAEQFMLEHPL